jgi:hypothetical protein
MIQRLYESNQPTSIMENEQALTVTLIIILFLLINAISALVVGFDSARHSVKQQTHGRWRYSPTAWATAGAIFGPATLLIYLVNRRQILPKPRETKFPLPHEVRGMFLATSVPLAFAVFAFMLIPMDRCALPSSTQAIREILMETIKGASVICFGLPVIERLLKTKNSQLSCLTGTHTYVRRCPKHQY